MKKLLAVLLAFTFMTSAAAVSASARSSDAKLLNIYGNNMLFSQNKPVRLAGSAARGAEILMQIILGGDTIVRTGSTIAMPDGTFEVETEGVEGGYANYEIKVYADGTPFASLAGVVFGELWLASGQSNMQYGLYQTYEGFALSKTGGTDDYLRVLDVPVFPEYNGSGDNLPFEALNDIKGASWYKGTDTWRLMSVSAVAYFFTCELRKELDVPVGIINASLGGSSIYTWLSRGAIDSAPAVKDYLAATGRYITREQWDSVKHSAFVDMTANYNKKIEPLGRFEPDGMIWYQGESNISEPHGAYTDAMNLMQQSYSALFGYEGSSMPFVFTQIASYHYADGEEALNLVGNFNIQLGEIQAQNPTARAMTTIYDVPLEWDTKKIDKDMGAVGAIHPMIKKPVGEKMAFAALGLVYGRRSSYSAPLAVSSEIAGDSVYVRFNNVGDGLAAAPSNGVEAPLYGFAVAGENGVYVEADAEIAAPDTVRVWSDLVPNPVSASYAYSQVNNYSNLFATENGSFTLGACAFVTRRLDGARYTQDKYWSTCDFAEIWRETSEPYFAPAFKAHTLNASVAVTETGVFSGSGALRVDYKAFGAGTRFVFGPNLTYKKNLIPTAFPAVNRDYSLNDAVRFRVKNLSGRPVTLKEMRYYTTALSWYSPCAAGTGSPSADIPADGQWHTVTLDLTRLCLYGDAKRFKANGSVLENVFDIRLVFGDETASIGDSGAVLVDEFRFSAGDAAVPDFGLNNLAAAFALVVGMLSRLHHIVTF
ncbi:MAG TPA: sialate O-acetylesterase [Clostridiales bacterium]|nr:sialate O-acetylesterase [Clostridiales bacterium]